MLKRLVETLAIGAVGGMALGLTGVPAGYLSGSILAVMIAALSGRSVGLPVPFVQAIFIFLGTSLGGVVTPEMLKGMATYPLSIAILIVAVFCVSISAAVYLRVVHRWDKINAYLASLPGAMSQVLALGIELGADMRAIAIVQSARVVIVAIGVPAGISLLGFVDHVVRPPTAPMTLQTVYELAILVVACCAGAYTAHRVRFPGGLMFGAMMTSAALHGSGVIHAVVPWWVTNTAAIALGSMIGARFTNMPLHLLLKYLGAAFGSFAVACSVAAAFGAIVIGLMDFPVAEVVIAYTPGSVDAMMLLALALHLDPVFVGAHHVVRVMVVAFFGPFIGRSVWKKPATPPQKLPPAQD